MTIKEKVASRELSEKLWKLGYRLESEFYYTKKGEIVSKIGSCRPDDISAPLPVELAEILPDGLDYGKNVYKPKEKAFYCSWHKEHAYYSTNLANSLAKMLIWLTMNGLIKPQEARDES